MQTLRCSCIVPCNGRHAPRFTELEIVTKVGVYRVHRCAQRHDACGVRGQTWPCSRPVAADQSCRCTCASLARHMCTRHTPTFAHYELVLDKSWNPGPWGSYKPCAYTQVCCGDGAHCCANGYTCHLDTAVCTADDPAVHPLAKRTFLYALCPAVIPKDPFVLRNLVRSSELTLPYYSSPAVRHTPAMTCTTALHCSQLHVLCQSLCAKLYAPLSHARAPVPHRSPACSGDFYSCQ